MRNKYVGLLIIGMALLIGVIVWLFNRALTSIINASCTHGPTCPMWTTLHLQTNIGLALMAFVILIGLYFIFFAKDDILREVHKEVRVIKEQYKPKKFDRKHYDKLMHGLDAGEKTVLSELLSNNGSVFQSKLVSSTGQSKVKITRILDRLEGKGIIERKRRGMTNIIILKES